jgi:hypothetical protein
VVSQAFDGFQIALLSLGGHTPELQVFAHTASECSHDHPPVRGAPHRAQKVDTNQEDLW